jgi:hypothetical protein
MSEPWSKRHDVRARSADVSGGADTAEPGLPAGGPPTSGPRHRQDQQHTRRPLARYQ